MNKPNRYINYSKSQFDKVMKKEKSKPKVPTIEQINLFNKLSAVAKNREISVRKPKNTKIAYSYAIAKLLKKLNNGNTYQQNSLKNVDNLQKGC